VAEKDHINVRESSELAMAYRPERLGPGAIYLRTLDEVFRLHSDLIKVAEVELKRCGLETRAGSRRAAAQSSCRRWRCFRSGR
jgi:hypothetical protein